MATFEARISKPEYVNWLKVGLALNSLKEGLVDFVQSECRAFHSSIVTSIFGNTAAPPVCQSCTVCDIKPGRRNQGYKIGCSDHVCDQLLEKILDQHLTSWNIPWSNSGDIKDWPVNYWSLCKVYMNPGQMSSQGPADCDCANILNLFINCKWFYSKIKSIIADEVRKHRNNLMHSTTMRLATADMKTWLSDMVKLLQSIADFTTRTKAKEAVEFIEKIKDTDIDLTVSDEIRVLKVVQQETLQTLKETKDEVETMKVNAGRMKTTVNELKKKIDDLEANNKKIQEQLEKLMSPEKYHDERAKQLKQKLIEFYKESCMEIAVSPLYTKQKFPIDKLYTDLVMVEQKSDRYSSVQEQKSGEGSSRQADEENKQIPVKSYNDMLYKEGKRIKTVYVLGEAGVGKSTLAKKMAADWVCAHTEEQAQEKLDVKTMKQFNFLFYVPLRSVSRCTSVFDAVCKSAARFSEFESTIKHLLQTQSENILVVCDGLDEVKVVLDLDHLHDCTIVTTTRPWKFDSVESPVDVVMELRGLTNEGIQYLIQKVLEVVHKDNSFETRHNLCCALGVSDAQLGRSLYLFRDEMDTSKTELKNLCKTPLILVHLIHLWFEDDKSLPTTMTEILRRVIALTLKCGEDRLASIEDIQDCQRLWKENVKSGKVLGTNSLLKKYKGLLDCLAHLAYDTLTGSVKENSLVFTDDDVEKYFTIGTEGDADVSVHLDACVRLGLITRTEYPSFSQTKYTLSFQHKTVHEFFTALSIVQSPSNMSRFVQYCTSVRVLLEISNVFKFVCGLSPKTGSTLSEKFLTLCNRDTDILQCRTRRSDEDFYFWQQQMSVTRLTLLYCDCMREIQAAGSNEVLHITDVVHAHTEDRQRQQLLLSLIKANKEKLISFTLEEYFSTERVRMFLPLLHHLRHLNICRITPIMFLMSESSILPESTNIVQDLQAVLSQGNLESLCLMSINFGNCPLDLSPLTYLSQLTLNNIDLTWSAWHRVLSSLGACPSLKELVLGKIKVIDRLIESISSQKLELNGWTQLQVVKITGSSIVFHINNTPQYIPLLSSLPQLTSLTELTLDYVGRDCGDTLVTVIPQLGNLRDLHLRSIRLVGQNISFAHNTHLRKVRFSYLSSCGILDFSHNTHLQGMDFTDVKFPEWRQYFPPGFRPLTVPVAAPHHNVTEQVYVNPTSSTSTSEKLQHSHVDPPSVKRMRYSETHPGTPLQLILSPDMELRTLKLGNIHLPKDTWCHVFSCVSKMQHLSQLTLRYVNATEDLIRIPAYMCVKSKLHFPNYIRQFAAVRYESK